MLASSSNVKPVENRGSGRRSISSIACSAMIGNFVRLLTKKKERKGMDNRREKTSPADFGVKFLFLAFQCRFFTVAP